jgi:zinc transport system substrate-binding protein
MALLSTKASDTILSSYRLQLPLGPASPPGVLPIALPRLDNLPGLRDEPDARRQRLWELSPTLHCSIIGTCPTQGELAGNAKVIELSQTPGLTLLPTREGGMWEAHEHGGEDGGADVEHGAAEHPDAHGDEGEHAGAEHETAGDAHGEADMHIWLDPENAKVLAAAIASALADADPSNAAVYQANAESLRQRLDELDRSLRDRLATVADRPYVVFHDGYQYFEHRYGVRAVGAITINPTVRPSAQRLGEIHERLEELDAACVFAEPQFEPTLVDTVVEGTSAKKGLLDPLGAALDAGPDQYFQLMNSLADSLVSCLGTGKSG